MKRKTTQRPKEQNEGVIMNFKLYHKRGQRETGTEEELRQSWIFTLYFRLNLNGRVIGSDLVTLFMCQESVRDIIYQETERYLRD